MPSPLCPVDEIKAWVLVHHVHGATPFKASTTATMDPNRITGAGNGETAARSGFHSQRETEPLLVSTHHGLAAGETLRRIESDERKKSMSKTLLLAAGPSILVWSVLA